MNLLRRLLHWFRRPTEHADVGRVSADWLKHQQKRESEEGWVDAPRWLSPAEIEQMQDEDRRRDN